MNPQRKVSPENLFKLAIIEAKKNILPSDMKKDQKPINELDNKINKNE